MRRGFCVWLAVLVASVAACEKKTPSAAPAPRAVPAEAASLEDDTVWLGEVGSLTGAQATFGISSRNGFDMAVREVNAAGGVKGRKLGLRVYDSQGRPEDAAQAATRLITRDKVVLILGEVSSTNSMAMAEKAQAAGVPMISHAATHPGVTQKGDYIFRICFIDPFQGFVMAKFAREQLALREVAILQDNKSAYSIGLTDVFTRKFTEMGGKVVGTESYSKGDSDFRAQLTALKKLKPQSLYIPGYYNDVGAIAQQAEELGLKTVLMGGDGWDGPPLFELGGRAIEGAYVSNHYSAEDPSPLVQNFIKKYQERYKVVPDSLAALGYDSARVGIEGMRRAKSLDGPDLREAIAATKDFPGVAGSITLNAKRDAEKPAVVLQVKDGKFKYVATVNP